VSELTPFRAETRAWLEANCPPVMRTRMPEEEQVAGGKRAEYVRPEQKIWLDRMAAKGWTAPTGGRNNTAAADCPTRKR
jgi:acyl-CoA dehydrogenase